MINFDYGEYRFGSAGFADERMITEAGLYQAHSGLYLGHDQRSRILRSDQQAAMLLVGGARSFKTDHIAPWLIDGHYGDHIICMDWKAQLAPIAQLQVLQGRRVINFNPRDRSGVPAHRMNPTSYLCANSPTLISDAKRFASDILPLSGSANADYFENGGQRWIEAGATTLARVNGVVELPLLADLMGQIGLLTDFWLSFEEHMAAMPEASIRQVVEELKAARESNNPNAGGANGIKGEIAKAFACLSDPELRAAVSPPYDFDFKELAHPDAPPYLVNIMEAQEFSQTSAPVVKALYTCAEIYKHRSVGRSRRQLWVLDEIGNIGKWPKAMDLATYGAAYIRTIFIVQSSAQLANLAPNADKIIPNSCGTSIWKGIRDADEARRVSSMLGTQTIEHEDFQMNEQARINRQNAMRDVLLNGADPFEAGIKLAQQNSFATHQTKAPRALMSHDEIMNMKNGNALVFMPGVLERPAMVRVPNYWKRRDLAGRYLGDPFHSPQGKVELRGSMGQQFHRIITEAVPHQLADWPQYQSGYWSYVEGFRPL